MCFVQHSVMCLYSTGICKTAWKHLKILENQKNFDIEMSFAQFCRWTKSSLQSLDHDVRCPFCVYDNNIFTGFFCWINANDRFELLKYLFYDMFDVASGCIWNVDKIKNLNLIATKNKIPFRWFL